MDDTNPIRDGEELHLENLTIFLESSLPNVHGDIEISQFPAGASNLTYCIKIGEEEFVLRRPPFGSKVKTAHDMSREFKVLSKLSKVYKPAPKPLLYCDNENIIGAEFYLMERRKGLIIRENPPSVLRAVATGSEDADTSVSKLDNELFEDSNHPDAKASPLLVKEGSLRTGTSVPRAVATELSLTTSQDYRKKVCQSFIENLADLHSLDYKKAGLEDLGKPEGYTKRQVEGWTKRYKMAKTDEHSELEKTIKWLSNNIPKDDSPALVHNDYKFDNVMLNPNDLTEIVAVLDWEMATIGSPLMDLGTTLAYWMSKDAGEELLSMPFNPRILMENISRQELVKMYANVSGRDVSNILYYYVFGTFKVAAIAQQIYYRYVKGFTKDKRFANFNFFVKRLGETGCKSLTNNAI